MRVIAGTARGRRLEAPAGLNTRPLTDRIREALFNILSPQIAGSRFLDLFAGSGSAGIEALSRGAAQAVFVELDAAALHCLQKNLQHCEFRENSEVMRMDVLKSLPLLRRQGREFDIIYVDPPFTQPEIFDRFMAQMDANADLLTDHANMIIRSHRSKELNHESKSLVAYRRKEYGESILNFYNKKQEV